jgi:mRNA interferase MazF
MLLQGEIILLPIPFTDLSSNKRRPVIVVSNDAYHRSTTDMVVIAMTSNPAAVEYGFVIESADLERGRLNHPGTVRADKIYTLSQSLIVARFGRVRRDVLAQIGEQIRELVEPRT